MSKFNAIMGRIWMQTHRRLSAVIPIPFFTLSQKIGIIFAIKSEERTMSTKHSENRTTIKSKSSTLLIDARIKELDDWRGKTLNHT